MMRLSLQTLSSIFIMSISKTDLTALPKLVENGPLEAGLPKHLDEELLLQLARDLRVVESAYDIGDDAEAPFEAAAFLVFHLMAKCSEKLYGKPGCSIALERLDHWVARYRYYVEREIVSRAIKMPCQADSDGLLAEIEAEIRSFE
jgi:hypothetical protein